MAQTINAAGLALIRRFEGDSLTAYADSAGNVTVGTGHLAPDMAVGDTITPEQDDAFLRQDLAIAENAVNSMVKVALNANQFSALVALVYNIGEGNFENSTLLRLLNFGQFIQASQQFLRWDDIDGQQSAALEQRRIAEQALFINPSVAS